MKTKHLFISLLVAAFAFANITNASAQIRFGLKGEAGLNNPTISKDALNVENLTTFSIGPAMEFMVPLAVVNVGLDAALLYNDNRMKVSEVISGQAKEQRVSNRYLKLPLNAKVKYGVSALPLTLYAAAGPYASYLLSGDKINFVAVKEDIKAKNFEAGANIGVGVEVLKMLQVGITYSVKLTDNYSFNKPEWQDALNDKSGDWMVSASLFF